MLARKAFIIPSATLLAHGDDDLSSVPTTMKRIRVSDIRANATALREVDRKNQQFIELCASVKRDGVLESILVRECEDPETHTMYYGLINGLQRLTAARDAGISELDCKVVVANDFETLRLQLITNAQRVETAPAEYSRHLSRMLNQKQTMTINELAEMINKSPAYISERLSLLKLSDKIAELVDSDKIPLSNAYALAKLPLEEQVNFVERAISEPTGTFVPAVTQRVKELRDARRKGENAKPAEFVPVARLRKVGYIKDEMAQKNVGPALISQVGASSAQEGWDLAIAWVLNMDPNTIAADKAKDEARKAEAEAAKERREKARAEKKAAEETAAALGA